MNYRAMSSIEDFIRENKGMFEISEPDHGHFVRFEERLRKAARRKRLTMVYRISAVAAVGLLLIMSGLWIRLQLNEPQPGQMRLSDVNHEMAEVEFYFTSQISSMTGELNNMNLESETQYQAQWLSEISQMDSVYQNLQRELATHPGDERIIQSMISYYQTKLRVIQHLIGQLRQIQDLSNNSNSTQYESVNY